MYPSRRSNYDMFCVHDIDMIPYALMTGYMDSHVTLSFVFVKLTNSKPYFTNRLTNTKPVYTYLNAFLVRITKTVMKFNNFENFENIMKFLICRLLSDNK